MGHSDSPVRSSAAVRAERERIRSGAATPTSGWPLHVLLYRSTTVLATLSITRSSTSSTTGTTVQYGKCKPLNLGDSWASSGWLAPVETLLAIWKPFIAALQLRCAFPPASSGSDKARLCGRAVPSVGTAGRPSPRGVERLGGGHRILHCHDIFQDARLESRF